MAGKNAPKKAGSIMSNPEFRALLDASTALNYAVATVKHSVEPADPGGIELIEIAAFSISVKLDFILARSRGRVQCPYCAKDRPDEEETIQ